MYVYFIRAAHAVKIGKAIDPEKRMAELQIGCPHRMHLVAKIKCKSHLHAFSTESHFHRVCKKWHIHGEWFHADGRVKRTIERIQLELYRAADAEEPLSELGRELNAEYRSIIGD